MSLTELPFVCDVVGKAITYLFNYSLVRQASTKLLYFRKGLQFS